MNITPVKGHRPRVLRVSRKFLERIRNLPKNHGEYIFAYTSLRRSFQLARKNATRKLSNPILNKITFTTFRHWEATMEYHKTKDILHVKQLLGHRDINTTLLYTQLVNFESDEYHTATAKTVKEARELAEAGFEYFDTLNDVHIYRKRK